jgi:hypothetical protein
MGPLHGLHDDRGIIELIEVAVVIQAVRRQALLEYFQRFGKLPGTLGRVGAVEANFDWKSAPAYTELEAAAAHLIEHANLFDQPQAMIEREQINEGPEANSLGPLRHCRLENAGRRRLTQWRAMVLGQVVGVEPAAVVGLQKPSRFSYCSPSGRPLPSK